MNLQRRPTKHVEAYLTELKDAGSIPATSTNFFLMQKTSHPYGRRSFAFTEKKLVHWFCSRRTSAVSAPHHLSGNKFPLKWFVMSASVSGPLRGPATFLISKISPDNRIFPQNFFKSDNIIL